MQLKKTGRALPRRLFALNTDFWAWKGKMSAKVGQVTPRQLQLEAGICSKIIPGQNYQKPPRMILMQGSWKLHSNSGKALRFCCWDHKEWYLPKRRTNRTMPRQWAMSRSIEVLGGWWKQKPTLEVREGLFSQHMRWENSCQFSCQFLSCDMRAMLLEH